MQRLIPMIVLATTILFMGCAPIPPASATRTSVAEAQVALTAAEKAALLYARLPQCPAQKPVCSEAQTIAEIKAADTVAYNAVRAARASGNSAELATANAAIAVFVSMVPVPLPAN